MKLNPAQLDRACGAVLGSAVGDALGAPYEFGLAKVGPHGPQMIGGGIGRFAPGEWTDDTTMAWCILDVASTGIDLRDDDALTRIACNFRAWYDTSPPDIGNQTRAILGQAGPAPTGATMIAPSYDLHARGGHHQGPLRAVRKSVCVSRLRSLARERERPGGVSDRPHQGREAKRREA